MENFLIFISQNFLPFLLFVSLLIFLFYYEGRKGGRRVDNLEATRIINKDNGLVVDLRSAGEFSEGHLVNAINVLPENIIEQINTLNTNKDAQVLLVCKTGSTSKKVSLLLKKEGYENINILSGGMLNWSNSGLPTSK
jgi:rhodanese-related sulfurtransferase